MSVRPNYTENIDGDVTVTRKNRDGVVLSRTTTKQYRSFAEGQGIFNGADTTRPWPKFRKALPYGVQITTRNGTNCALDITMTSNGEKYEVRGYLFRPYATYVSIPAPSVLISDRLKSLAELKALGKVKAQKINLGVAFAERRKTAQHLTDTIMAVVRTVRGYRRWAVNAYKRRRSLNQFKDEPLRITDPLGKIVMSSREAGSRWLEVQYGWNPLMADVAGACEALETDPLAFMSRVVANVYDRERYSVTGSYSPGFGIYPHADVQIMRKCKVRLDFYPDFGVMRTYAQLGLLNPLEIAWELVPYSFVVDWFTPIGDWLSQIDAHVGVKFHTGSASNSGRAFLKHKLAITPTPQYIVRDYGCTAKVEGFAFTRTVYNNWPFANLPMPDLGGLVGKRWISALALLQNVLK